MNKTYKNKKLNIAFILLFVLSLQPGLLQGQPNTNVVSKSNLTSQATFSIEITGDAGWRMLCAPITGFTVSDISDDTAIQGITNGFDENADANFYIYPDADISGLISEPEFVEPADMTTTWEDGWGFIVYFFDNTTNGSSELPINLDVEGTALSSDLNIAINKNKFTLVGNPFDENIYLDSLQGDGVTGINGGLVSPVHVWQDSASSSGGYYKTFNFGSDEGHIVAMWQGFFLESAADNLLDPGADNVTVPISSTTTDAATISIFDSKNKKGPVQNNDEKPRMIKMELHGPESTVDKAISLYFPKSGSEGIDGYDGSKLRPLVPEYAALSFVQELEDTTRLLTQDARPYNPEGIQEYQLELSSVGLSGEFTIKWPEWRNIPDDWSFKFYDNETGITTDMRAKNHYKFNHQSQPKEGAKNVSPKIQGSAKLLRAEQMKKDAGSEARFIITLEPDVLTNIDSDPGTQQPEKFILHQNYPNPFNPSTIIQYDVPEKQPVKLIVYDALGRSITTLVNEQISAGRHQIEFNALELASGLYIYRLEVGNKVFTKKMMLIK